MRNILLPLLCFLAVASSRAAEAPAPLVAVGVARVDITPAVPVRLAGYQSRKTPFERVGARLHARALAIGADADQPAVLITVDLIGISEEITNAVAAALGTSHGIARERVAICATHTHAAPSLRGVLPFMFSVDLPEEEIARIAEYTATLRDQLVAVARAALADRRPGRLAWAEGRVGFAAQRRVIADGRWRGFGVTPDGSVDHALPVLRVTDEHGALRALYLSYACHGTTLTGNDNFVHPDWAGDAAARLEDAHAGAVVLVSLGCGGDANPNPRGKLEHVATHGAAVAAEVERLLAAPMRPLGCVTEARTQQISLALDHVAGDDELRARAAKVSAVPAAYAARKFLAQLDAGRALPSVVPYRVQTWRFGDDLAMVFLAGEVVSDYSLRLRRELDASRLWVNGYSNDVPCYIAAKRMFPEGGYEVDGSMDYYGWPTRLAIGTEDQIIGAVRALVPAAFARAGDSR